VTDVVTAETVVRVVYVPPKVELQVILYPVTEEPPLSLVDMRVHVNYTWDSLVSLPLAKFVGAAKGAFFAVP
jgi:hypothetical protein